MTVQHIRILAALLAAIILHAVLLSWPLPSSNSIAINNGLLHVDLVKAARPSVARSASPLPPTAIAHAQSASPQKPSTQPKKTRHQQPPLTTHTMVATRQLKPMPAPVKSHAPKKNPRSTARQETGKSSPPLHAETTQETDRLPVSHGESAMPHLPPAMAPTMVPTMAADVQSMLLTNIHYPAQARRRGWQGAGEFQLDIDSQSIRKITMLMSTGHAILDRAVRRGLGDIEHVPVANGQYRLPVEFRLQ